VGEPLALVSRLILRPSIFDLLVPTDRARGEVDLRALAVDFGRMVYTRPVGYFLDEDDDADPGNHTVQVVARRLGGMSRDDLPKVADYVEMVEVRARLQNRG
jgi:hypothetical protein